MAARGLLLLIAASLVLSVALEPLVSQTPALDPDAIREALQGTGAVAPLVFVGVVVLAIFVAPIPSIPLDIAAAIFGGLAAVTVLPLTWWARPQRERAGHRSDAAEEVSTEIVM